MKGQPDGGVYAYHRVPPNLRGTTLYPLNQLWAIYPDIAEAQLAKYAGRAHALTRTIPPLDCLWNDVLMFSPVHPAALKAAMLEAGHGRFPRRWFAVESATFTAETTAVYVPGWSPAEARFEPYEPGSLARYAVPTDEQRAFYRRVPPGQPVLLLGGTPHILYRGTLDIAEARVIAV